MSGFRVASVPYVNAIPLVARLEETGQVEVLYDVPANLPALLEAGEVDAILVSSIDALRVPGRRMASGVCIGSCGSVKSVRLFSKVPPAEIQTLALDQSSMTSNRLAQIILAERYGATPATSTCPPDLLPMLEEHDACVLIGDIGMTASGEGLHVLDLGEEWTSLTGKPFVWAGWIGTERLTPELSVMLGRAAAHYGVGKGCQFRDDAIIKIAQARSDWTEEALRDYFFEVMVYQMGDSEIEGLREFKTRLLSNGFDECQHFPQII
jgi:chorismate dehydratase